MSKKLLICITALPMVGIIMHKTIKTRKELKRLDDISSVIGEINRFDHEEFEQQTRNMEDTFDQTYRDIIDMQI